MRLIIPTVLILAALATGASAQISGATAGIVAAGAEGVGQGLGAAVAGGPSVFVTATGKAPLAANVAAADAYGASVEGKAPSAVEAARRLDEKLDAARAIAARYHVVIDIGETAFSRQGAGAPPPRAGRPGEVTVPVVVVKPVAPPAAEIVARDFIARSPVGFRPSDPRQVPAFLDSLAAADIEVGPPAKGSSLAAIMAAMIPSAESAGAGSPDVAVWDRASANAIAEARRQASVLAAAAGRQVGEAQQILMLTRNTQANEASVTVAVRFALTPAK
jgi:hypothetical protein